MPPSEHIRGHIIVGAGGHGQVVAEILLTDGHIVRGFWDENTNLSGRRVFGLPVWDMAPSDSHSFIVAIGDNEARRRRYIELAKAGKTLVTAIHPVAIITRGVHIGSGSVLCAGCVVGTGSRIGVDTILNTGCTVDHHNAIGDHVHIAPGVHLAGGVSVGDGSLVGIGSVVLPGVSIGEDCVVGAGSVVTRDVPDSTKVAGNPAKAMRARKAAA